MPTLRVGPISPSKCVHRYLGLEAGMCVGRGGYVCGGGEDV